MENNQEETKKFDYIRKIANFCKTEIKIEHDLKNQIKNIGQPSELYLINKEIVSNFKKPYLYSTIKKSLNEYIEKHIKNNFEALNISDFVNTYKKIFFDTEKIKDLNKLPIFFEPEILKIMDLNTHITFLL